MERRILVLPVVALVFALGVSSATGFRPLSLTSEAVPAPQNASALPRAAAPWGLGFTENRGQVRNPQVRFYLVTSALHVGFASGTVLYLRPDGAAAGRGVMVAAAFEGASRADPVGLGRLAFSSNFLFGDNRAQWMTDVPSFAQVAYPDLYPGISLTYDTTASGPEYTYVLSAGADLASISIRFEGQVSLEVDRSGNLVLHTNSGDLVESAPHADQAGRPVGCGFVLQTPRRIGFRCEGVDPSRPLRIDPIVYSTFLGGVDNATAVATDSSGSAYVTGSTGWVDFPTTPGAYNTTYASGTSQYVACCHTAYVSKLTANGSALVYSTFLGGSLWSHAVAIAVDGSGDAFVAGTTISPDFPATWGRVPVPPSNYPPIQCTFVVALNPAGNGVLYSAVVANASASSIALDSAGHAFVTGTNYTGFITTPGAYNVSGGGYLDVFAFELTAAGNGFVYAAAIGGRGIDVAKGLAVDGSDDVYVTGYTNSGDFPTTPGSYHPIPNGTPYLIQAPFLAKLSADGSKLLYSTLLGPDISSDPAAVAVDGAGSAYVTGRTNSSAFPATPGAYQTTFKPPSHYGYNAFVEKVNATGGGLVYATYLGGNVSDSSYAIRLDAAGDSLLTGCTWSADFPTTSGALATSFTNPSQGYSDAFLTVLDPAGSSLIASTFLGGSYGDCGSALAWGPGGDIFVAGSTTSFDFPVTLGSLSTTFVGPYNDAFVARLSSLNGTVPFRMTVASDPSGLEIDVNGTSMTTPQTFSCAAGSSVTLFAVSPQLVQSYYYRFVSWSDGGAQGHSVACSQLTTFTASFTSSPIPDFVLLASPSRTTTAPGGNATVDLTVLGVNGYAGPIVTCSLTGAPSGVAASFSPTFVAPSGATTLTLAVSGTVAPAVYPMTIQGSNGTATRSVPFQLEILGLALTANATLVPIQVGSLGTATVTVTLKGNYTSPVVLSVSGLPAGVGVSFSTAQFLATGTATLTFIVAASAMPGTYPMAVDAAGAGVTRTVSLSLQILASGGGPPGGSPEWSVLLIWFLGVAAVASVAIYMIERRKR